MTKVSANKKIFRRGILVCVGLLLFACKSTPITDTNNICSIFKARSSWYKAAKKSTERWGGSITLPMAIMYQESSFKHDAKPPMQYFLGFIPTGRASDAYGYSQALKSTWAAYQKEVGSRFRDRDNFANAFDFIQWYVHKSYTVNGASKWDYYAQYLNYHEGQGGYSRGTYRNKKWLLQVAQKVDQRAKRYSSQLAQCEAQLARKRSWF